VPPLADSPRSQRTASRFALAVAATGAGLNRRDWFENSISSSRSASPSDSISSATTCLALSSGPPAIEPLVSSSTIRSRGVARSIAPGAGGTIVTRP
jgi:hypothetical protein